MSIFLLQNHSTKPLKHRFMPSQTQWGIPLIVLPLPSERAGERLFFLTLSSQIQRGISLIILPLPSERDGERLSEIPLQIIRHYCSQINSLSLKIAFVTYRKSVSYKEACKRCPFALQNMPFYNAKGRSWESRKGKNLTKIKNKHQRETASPSPSEGGDVRGYGGMRKEGMCLTGYGMLCVRDIKGEGIKAKVHGLILKV